MSRKPARQVVLLACLALVAALPAGAAPGRSSGRGLRHSEVLSYQRTTRKLRLERPDGKVVAARVRRGARITLDGTRRLPRELPAGALVMEAGVTRKGALRRLATVSPQTPPAPGPAPSGCDGVPVGPDDALEDIVEASPPGTTFCLQAGVHRLTDTLTPRDGDAFVGEPGAVVSGARTLTFAPEEGATWVASDQTQQSPPHGECQRGDACRYNEDVFFDGRPLERVTARSELGPGRFFFDYERDTIHIADDPSGHAVEGAVTPQFLAGDPSVSAVVVRGLVIEKFATPAQQGAVDAGGGPGWLVEGNEVRLNHGAGVLVATEGRIVDNFVDRNGQQGVGAEGRDVLVAGNEIAYNNTAGFSPGWSAAGAKFSNTTRLTVRRNLVHDNAGPGLWTDANNLDVLVEGNVVRDNSAEGVFHEIGYDAVIRDNEVRSNGWGACEWMYGAGILIAHSSDVAVYRNEVRDNCNGIVGIQQSRGRGPRGPYRLSGLRVYDNVVSMPSGQTGIANGDGGTDVFTDWDNRFDGNSYFLDLSRAAFGWDNRTMTKDEWVISGGDAGGRFMPLEGAD